MHLIPTSKKVHGKEVFLEEHAFKRISERGISIDAVVSTIRRPCELYIERKYKPLFSHMKRYVAMQIRDDMVNIVVYDEDEIVVVITSWSMKSMERYNRYKERRLRDNTWIRLV